MRIHTLAWEVYDARGEYAVAADRLMAEHVIEMGSELIREATLNHEDFVATYFPEEVTPEERSRRYDLWRQRAMGGLAMGFASLRLQRAEGAQHLDVARMFVETCLAPAGFPCYGTRARLHYFLGHLYESEYDLAKAAQEYDQSLICCIARAEKRLTGDPAQRETERLFAIYCLGKLELKLGQLDYEQGRLRSAKRHAKEAGLLLRVSQDALLPQMAALLNCRIERDESSFFENGWSVVGRMRECCRRLSAHRPYALVATIEAAKASVYLRHADRPPPEESLTFPTLPQAVAELESVSREADKLRLPGVRLDARLAIARTLTCQGKFKHALKIVGDARLTAGSNPRRKMTAELNFVEGKIYAAWAAQQKAKSSSSYGYASKGLELFEGALNAGHSSLTFEVACREQIADMLWRLSRVRDAELALEKASVRAREMEHMFLHERLNRLRAKLDETQLCVFHFEPGFDFEGAKRELTRQYLLSLARQFGLEPSELPKNFARIKESIGGLTREKLETLVKHF